MIDTRVICRALIAGVFLLALAACSRSDSTALIASAKTYLSKADYAAAVIELKSALKSSPNNAEARFLLAKALLEGGDPVSAETELRKALELKYPADDVYPALAQALLRQGQYRKLIAEAPGAMPAGKRARAEVGAALSAAYLASAQPKEARVALEEALAAQADNVNVRVMQAKLLSAENKLPEALQLIDGVLVAAPNDSEALMTKAGIEGQLGKRSEAIATMERLVALRPDALAARFLLVSAYVQAGQLDKAAPQLDAMRKYAPADARTQYAEALVAYAAGNMTVAQEAIQKSLRAAPDYLPAAYLSGLVDLRRGSYASAEDSLRQVVAGDASNEGARRALAETYMRRGQATKALEVLEPSLRRAPDEPVLLRAAAEIYLALNNPAAATELFERANAIDKNNVTGRVRLAQIRLAAGDSGQALKDLEELSSANPTSREPDLALVSAFLKGRDFARALVAAQSLEQKQPNSPLPQNIKGLVYMAKGDVKNARASFEKAIAIDPNFVVAEQNLARLEVGERNFDGARKRYQSILAKDPKSESSLLALAEILVITNAPPAEVKAALDRAIAANPTSALSRLALVSYNARLKDFKAATAAAQAAQTAIPDSAKVLEALGIAQLAAGENNQAADTFRKLAQLQPDSHIPLRRLADVQVRTKDYDAAIRTLVSAMAIAPSEPEMWMALAGIYTSAGRVEAGLAEAQRLQKQYPKRALGYGIEGELMAGQGRWPETAAAYRAAFAREPLPFNVGRLHSALLSGGKTDEAAKVAQKWLADHPQDMAMRRYLAMASTVRNDHKAVIAQLREALKIEPDNADLLNNLAWSLGEVGDPTAVQYAERAYGMAPNNAAYADTYGWVLYQRGDTARSLELLRKASGLAPDDAAIRLRLARALLKSGDKGLARKELEIVEKTQSAELRSEAAQLLKDL